MRLLVVGDKLQGSEAAYLEREAGYDVALVDRRWGVPVSGPASETQSFDLVEGEDRNRTVFLNRPEGSLLALQAGKWSATIIAVPPSATEVRVKVCRRVMVTKRSGLVAKSHYESLREGCRDHIQGGHTVD